MLYFGLVSSVSPAGFTVYSFGHKVDVYILDQRWNEASAIYYFDWLWNTIPKEMPKLTSVIIAPLSYKTSDCTHRVKWFVTPRQDHNGFIVVIDPDTVGTVEFYDILEEAFRSEILLVSRLHPAEARYGACMD